MNYPNSLHQSDTFKVNLNKVTSIETQPTDVSHTLFCLSPDISSKTVKNNIFNKSFICEDLISSDGMTNPGPTYSRALFNSKSTIPSFFGRLEKQKNRSYWAFYQSKVTSIFGKSSGGTLDARQNQTLEELQLDGFWNKEERKIISTVLGMGKKQVYKWGWDRTDRENRAAKRACKKRSQPRDIFRVRRKIITKTNCVVI